jgi:hypothetical protein
MSSHTRSGPTGWAVFAGSVLAIAGSFNIIYGLAAIFRDQAISTTGGQVIIWDFTRWGWILLIFGGLQLAAGMALFGGAGWARWVAVVLAGLNAVANIGFITVYPFWTALIVGLDILVIYQLSARWHDVDREYYASYDTATAGASAARDQMTRMRTGL